MKHALSRLGRRWMVTCMTGLVTLGLSHCEKAKELAEKAKKAGEVAAQADQSTEVDEELQSLVDQTEEGVIFRKDLPFPMDLEVRHEMRLKMTRVRGMEQSALGATGRTISGELIAKGIIERFPGAVRLTSYPAQITFEPPTEGAAVPAENPAAASTQETDAAAAAKPSKPMVFRYDGAKWKPEKSGPSAVDSTLSLLGGDLPQFLTMYGATPRPLWFSPRRYRIGDRVDLKGDMLAVVVDWGYSGELRLTLEAIENVNNHPCGKFKVEGDYRQKGMVMGDGSRCDTDVTVTAGTIWVSLIYPLVIRESYETVQTMKLSTDGRELRMQGAMEMSLDRHWKMVDR